MRNMRGEERVNRGGKFEITDGENDKFFTMDTKYRTIRQTADNFAKI